MSFNTVYLHGFASGPASGKAQMFKQALHETFGVDLTIPDLNVPDFSHLTLTAMLEHVDNLIDTHRPTLLIGSSLGGYVAALTAERRRHDIDALILMAPAFEFATRRLAALDTSQIEHWKTSGTIDVEHHAYQKTLPLHYAIVEDATTYERTDYHIMQPTLVFHGLNDDLVDWRLTRKYLEFKTNCRCVYVQDDHQLLNSLDTIRDISSDFIKRIYSNSGSN